MGRAFSSRNYRLFFAGQSISLVGTWLTRIATSWLVYRLTKSPMALGIIGFAGQIPTLIFAPYAGVLVDRKNRHRIMVVTQFFAMLQSLALAALALSGMIQVWHVLVLSIAQGIINAFDTPARQAFLIEMVEKPSDLPNAIALNSSMVNGTRLLGPAIGGVLIARVGEGMCFLVDGISYMAVIASLLMMHVKPREIPLINSGARAHFQEALGYAWHFTPIRSILLLIAIVSLAGMPYVVLMPAVASQVLHGDAHTLGFLMGASGVGALFSALYLASRESVLGLGRIDAIAAGVFGAALIAFSFSTSIWLSCVILMVIGSSMMMQMAASNTILQTIVEESKRGRIMGLFTLAFFGTVPFGSLLAGALAERIGPMPTIAFGGICCVAASAWFAMGLPQMRDHIRPIYRRKGILPELAVGINNASELSRAENE